MNVSRANLVLIAKGLGGSNLLNVGFLQHAMQATTGQPGELKLLVSKLTVESERQTVDYTVLLSSISSVAAAFVYVCEDPSIDLHALQQTMIPDTELRRSDTSEHSSSTSDSSASRGSGFSQSLQALTTKEARVAGLNLGDENDEREQEVGNTADLMRREVIARDVSCRVTGNHSVLSENAHLVKKCNPGLVRI